MCTVWYIYKTGRDIYIHATSVYTIHAMSTHQNLMKAYYNLFNMNVIYCFHGLNKNDKQQNPRKLVLTDLVRFGAVNVDHESHPTGVSLQGGVVQALGVGQAGELSLHCRHLFADRSHGYSAVVSDKEGRITLQCYSKSQYQDFLKKFTLTTHIRIHNTNKLFYFVPHKVGDM